MCNARNALKQLHFLNNDIFHISRFSHKEHLFYHWCFGACVDICMGAPCIEPNNSLLKTAKKHEKNIYIGNNMGVVCIVF